MGSFFASHKTQRLLLGLVLSVWMISSAHGGSKPHIVIIMADDLGYDDVSIHGSDQIPTPNIDAIGVMGVQLNQMYVAPECSPSRSSLLTGKYASNLGMQANVIPVAAPYGLGLDQKTIAEYMKSGGYSTHMIGKWHLGFFEKPYTPLFRGFDTYFGHLGPYIDYFNHSVSFGAMNGLDMRDNLNASWSTQGQYVTDLYTEMAVNVIQNHNQSEPMFLIFNHNAPHAANNYAPLQAPQGEIDEFSYIENENRRIYAAMVSEMDKSVGKVVKALADNQMIENCIVLFMSDNGAPVEGSLANDGSNFPLRGQKVSPWQGAVRSAAAIWSPLLAQRQRISTQMVHITDWLPTFARFAGVEIEGQIDGMDVWPALSNDLPSPRTELLVHYDQTVPFAAYIDENYKLVNGTTSNGTYDGWISPPIDPSQQNLTFGENYGETVLQSDVARALSSYTQTATEQSEQLQPEDVNELRLEARVTCNGYPVPAANSTESCDPLRAPCLFDIIDDPCERNNLASKYPDILEKIQTKLDYYISIAEAPRNKPADPRANPKYYSDTWTWWYDVIYGYTYK